MKRYGNYFSLLTGKIHWEIEKILIHHYYLERNGVIPA